MPGHERFVRTMVAGATGIDLFLLVVAADDGVMPQTREHLAVLELLGVPGGLVALTKADAVGAERARRWRRPRCADLLAPTPYAGAPVVPVSARLRHGPRRAARRDSTASRAPLAPRPSREGPTRLHVDRCFTLRGIGTVVTGHALGGSRRGGRRRSGSSRAADGRGCARCRCTTSASPGAHAGRRVALNLAGVERSEVAAR